MKCWASIALIICAACASSQTVTHGARVPETVRDAEYKERGGVLTPINLAFSEAWTKSWQRQCGRGDDRTEYALVSFAIEVDGSTSGHVVAARHGLNSAGLTLCTKSTLEEVAPTWTFEPPILDGQSVRVDAVGQPIQLKEV